MRPTTTLASLLTAAALAVAGLTTGAGAASAGPPADGGPTSWTSVSTGSVGILQEASLHRTADQVLHVVYPRTEGGGIGLAHTAIGADGTTAAQSAVLPGWSIMDATPALVAGPAGGQRVLFGGQQTSSPGYWSDGRVYTATAAADGASWTLPAEAVGISHSAFASYGTAGTTLADGAPIAAFPLNSSITWHVGTGGDPDQSFDVASCCAYDLALTRSGDAVWLAWYGNGGTEATEGTFVRQILPILGPIQKAPGSSVGADSLGTGRVALAAREGGGVYAAYCAGYPTCSDVRLWQVGSPSAVSVPGSAGARTIGLSAAPGGELWTAWSDAGAEVKAVRTYGAATTFGSVVGVGRPAGAGTVYSLAIDGRADRADVVANNGNGLWHTQVAALPAAPPAPPQLALKASPKSWRAGKTTKVRFTVTTAGTVVPGATVKAGKRSCTTAAKGTCTLKFTKKTKPGKVKVTATRSGYQSATTTLKIKKKKPKK